MKRRDRPIEFAVERQGVGHEIACLVGKLGREGCEFRGQFAQRGELGLWLVVGNFNGPWPWRAAKSSPASRTAAQSSATGRFHWLARLCPGNQPSRTAECRLECPTSGAVKMLDSEEATWRPAGPVGNLPVSAA